MVPTGGVGSALLPDVQNIRAASATVAREVIAAAQADGVATKQVGNITGAVQDGMWQVAYPDVAA